MFNFIQFVAYSMQNYIVYRTPKKLVFCWLCKLLCKPYQALYRCSKLNLKISRLKWHRFETSPEVRLLNKCSKICAILNFDSLECFWGPLTYCSASDIGFFTGLWTDFIAFNCQVVKWALIFANPVFKNSGIYTNISSKNFSGVLCCRVAGQKNYCLKKYLLQVLSIWN